jgi:tRNA threonylcarbamoyladenosine biosynthesis protein TsaE
VTARDLIVSLDELPAFASGWSADIRMGDRICLSGELGSGKTTFLFHVARALGVDSDAGFSSPTFSIFNRYEAREVDVNHVDLYRLRSYAEFESLDLMPFFEHKDAVTFVEWGEKFPELRNFFTARLRFEPVGTASDRRRVIWEKPWPTITPPL